ncbi:MAG: hypothetical protein DLM72_12125 [Candidatus Nitrosopolaris wilkensis]|nr:MAG: hypothetical protein DLM72_12125 [Candidatus Nitrosopolaris wilkensis]
MSHKIVHTIKNDKPGTALVAITALAAVLLASAAAIGTDNASKTKGFKNDSINMPTKQKQECHTAGATSPVTGSCTAVPPAIPRGTVPTNVVNNTGGVMAS